MRKSILQVKTKLNRNQISKSIAHTYLTKKIFYATQIFVSFADSILAQVYVGKILYSIISFNSQILYKQTTSYTSGSLSHFEWNICETVPFYRKNETHDNRDYCFTFKFDSTLYVFLFWYFFMLYVLLHTIFFNFWCEAFSSIICNSLQCSALDWAVPCVTSDFPPLHKYKTLYNRRRE